jgi:hypothetical protein
MRESRAAGNVTKKVRWIPDADISHEKPMELVEVRYGCKDTATDREVAEIRVSEEGLWSEMKLGLRAPA